MKHIAGRLIQRLQNIIGMDSCISELQLAV